MIFDVIQSRSKMKIIGLIGILAVTAVAGDQLRQFPSDFKFGVATASYQVEGAWNVNGKGENIWDYATHTQPHRVLDLSNGDDACNSYYSYKRDVEMIKSLGVDFYRFSLSWSRILPTGFINKINDDGIQYYNNLINELLDNGIEPVVTIYHWDLPRSLQELGGWPNPVIADYFVDFSRVAFESFGDRVKTWITFNEPYVVCEQGYGSPTNKAPYLETGGIGDYLCSKTVLLAHGRTYRIYHAEYASHQKGRLGMTGSLEWALPATDLPDDLIAVENVINFMLPWFTDPIYRGDYPEKMKEMVGAKSLQEGYSTSRLPEFTEEEKSIVKGTADFYGLNHYTTNLYSHDRTGSSYPSPSLSSDLQVVVSKDPSWSVSNSTSTWLTSYPQGFREVLNWVKNRYGNPEVQVFENGFSTHPEASRDDDDRVDYYRSYLNALLDAIHEDGCNVTAYTAWSLMDNFEWSAGYTSRFGLFEVDFNSPEKTRRERKSALVYKDIVRSKVVDYSYNPTVL